MKVKIILLIIAVLFLGALGAFVFNMSFMPYFLASAYFENFQFVKDFKKDKIIINPTEQVYIQENVALQRAIEKVAKSVVAVQVTTLAGNRYLGSGFIVTSDGLIVVTGNVIPPGSKFTIFINGQKVDFNVQKANYAKNLILIKVDKADLPTVGFADFNNLKLGQRVFLLAASSTNAEDWLVNEGIVRSFTENAIKTTISEKQIVVGSPLFNISGELVGLNYIDQDGKISAISINTIKTFLGL